MGDSDRFLYAPIQPYNSGYLVVSSIHKIYYEECGNTMGVPAVFIHAGPGAAVSDRDRRYFDPEAYRIVLFDQRGCGKSTPSYSLEENDTWKLIADMEKLREHLGIKKWLVFGGSWGSTLALLYAEMHIDHVSALIVHGVFTFRPEEIRWLYQEGASFIFPEYWDEYVAPIPEEERGDLLSAFCKRLNGSNKEESYRCIKALTVWEACNTRLHINPAKIEGARSHDPEEALKGAKYEMHFFTNQGFLKRPNQILDDTSIIRDSGVPVTIIQGRYDAVAPMKTAWELHKLLKESEFHLVDNAGHSSKEEGITKKLVEACDKYKKIILE